MYTIHITLYVYVKVGKTSISLRTKPVGVVLSSRFIESLLKRNSYIRSDYNNMILVIFLRFVLVCVGKTTKPSSSAATHTIIPPRKDDSDRDQRTMTTE